MSAQPRRGRWLVLVLFLVFVTVPLVEIFLLIQTGKVIGALPTIALVIAIAVLGSWLAKREGTRAWQALHQAITEGRMPQRELMDGALVLVGAVLLIFPGFFTDVVGLVFLLPVTRPAARAVLGRVLANRVAYGATKVRSRRGHPQDHTTGALQGEVIDPR